MPRCGPVGARHPVPARRSDGRTRGVPSEITLAKHEALDLVAGCDELLDFAEAGDHVEVAFTVEGGCVAWCLAAC